MTLACVCVCVCVSQIYWSKVMNLLWEEQSFDHQQSSISSQVSTGLKEVKERRVRGRCVGPSALPASLGLSELSSSLLWLRLLATQRVGSGRSRMCVRVTLLAVHR